MSIPQNMRIAAQLIAIAKTLIKASDFGGSPHIRESSDEPDDTALTDEDLDEATEISLNLKSEFPSLNIPVHVIASMDFAERGFLKVALMIAEAKNDEKKLKMMLKKLVMGGKKAGTDMFKNLERFDIPGPVSYSDVAKVLVSDISKMLKAS